MLFGIMNASKSQRVWRGRMDAASQYSIRDFHSVGEFSRVCRTSCLHNEDGAAIGSSLNGRLEPRIRRRVMKRRIALGAVVAAVALMGSLDSAKADHCPTYRPSYSYGYSGSYYRPGYSYGYSNSYYRPSYSYRPTYGYSQPSFGYSRPGFSITFGSGRSGFSFGRSYGHSGHHGHRH